MKITLVHITVRELVKKFKDRGENGVVAYGGKLDVRPPYQREFVYDEPQQAAVIDSIYKGFPLSSIYWAKDGDEYEIIDGQQRTLSICKYVDKKFSVPLGNSPERRQFHNLSEDEREKILDYELTVYQCEGTDSEKIDWFRTINIAGEKLTDQELRNAVYRGPWVTDAKKKFSKSNCAAYDIGKKYLNGMVNRQKYLETAIRWISNDKIEDYMGTHKDDPNANDLWSYFEKVIKWVKRLFPTYRKEMKGIAWGPLYNKFKDKKFDAKELEKEVSRLMEDEDVTNKRGIYYYVLNKNERHLNVRAFTQGQKREAYERQKGICPVCEKHFDIDKMEGDHITPWSKGGKSTSENCQMLCKPDNRTKGAK